ncbi:ABC transporter substrate binding protein [Zavarzinia sp. CC-PAN008]|uniref:ABC transporter substrate-binding protein n=1 Tax=Zavarzinia sp. CC-PAN008 TaxID=3243332 RepID=UPI003F74A461
MGHKGLSGFLAAAVLVLAMLLSPGATWAQAPGAGQGADPAQRPFRIFMVLHRTGAVADVGFRDQLESSGLPLDFIVRNIENDATRMPAIVEEIRATKPDLIYAQSTSVTTGIVGRLGEEDPARFITDIPVVFSMVADPVGSRLIPAQAEGETLRSGRNFTGAIHVVSLDVQLNAMRAYLPLKRLAVVYNPTERTQRDMMNKLIALTAEAGIELFASTPLDEEGEPSVERIPRMIAELAALKPDLLYIPPVNFFGNLSEELTAETLKHDLPTFCAIEAQIRADGMTGLVAPLYNVGQLAGYKAEQILRGEHKSGEIPIETLSRFSFVVNMRVARRLELYPPMNILRYAQIVDD